MEKPNFLTQISEKMKGLTGGGKNKAGKTGAGSSTGMNKSINVSEIIEKVKAKLGRNTKGVPLEINLVPDVKYEMIKTMKLRNFIFFLCIVVAAGSVGATAIFASIAGGQQAIVDGKKTMIDSLSKKLNSYGDLSEFLTVKDQLGNIATITSNKRVLSRTFGILGAIIPTGVDKIEISELNVNLAEEAPTFAIEAQADAGNPPYIDYNVLDAFKKSMKYLRYDYGKYVDKEGVEIPAYCMIENDEDGAMFSDADDKGLYAYWLITGEGCNPSYTETDEDENGKKLTEAQKLAAQTEGYTTETYKDQTVVKVWRTPQFEEWYSKNPKEGKPTISLEGVIENVAHFKSECISYAGYDSDNYASDADETVVKTVNGITWAYVNDTCVLVPENEEGGEGIEIYDSSNGRDADDNLVLRFSAVITLEPKIYSFDLTHFMAIGPSNRLNVTDSYVQIQNIFSERAADCDPSDAACLNNSNGGN